MKKYLVLDIGGSAVKYAKMDEEATILEKGSVKTPLDKVLLMCNFKEKFSII